MLVEDDLQAGSLKDLVPDFGRRSSKALTQTRESVESRQRLDSLFLLVLCAQLGQGRAGRKGTRPFGEASPEAADEAAEGLITPSGQRHPRPTPM
jgi:hypothetical protein